MRYAWENHCSRSNNRRVVCHCAACAVHNLYRTFKMDLNEREKQQGWEKESFPEWKCASSDLKGSLERPAKRMRKPTCKRSAVSFQRIEAKEIIFISIMQLVYFASQIQNSVGPCLLVQGRLCFRFRGRGFKVKELRSYIPRDQKTQT